MSYVIVSKKSGIGVMQFYNPDLRQKINTDRYIVEEMYIYLCRINREIRDADARGIKSPYHTG